jgi:hypothetical protein
MHYGNARCGTAIAATIAIGLGCGTTATLTLRNGLNMEGRIEGSSRTGVRVGQTEVARSDIADIDHPGNVAMTIGLVLVGCGLVDTIIVAAADVDPLYYLNTLPEYAVGLGLSIWGGVVWGGSTSRASEGLEDGSSASGGPTFAVAPWAAPDGQGGGAYGAVFGGRF